MEPAVLSAMLESTWEFAKLMLAKRGEFYPFGETADAAGKRTMEAGLLSEDRPDPRGLYSFLEESLLRKVGSGAAAAVALAANVDIPAAYQAPFPDGVRVHVEAVGYSRYVYLPYRLEPRRFLDRVLRRPYGVTYAEPFGIEVQPYFFRAV